MVGRFLQLATLEVPTAQSSLNHGLVGVGLLQLCEDFEIGSNILRLIRGKLAIGLQERERRDYIVFPAGYRVEMNQIRQSRGGLVKGRLRKAFVGTRENPVAGDAGV